MMHRNRVRPALCAVPTAACLLLGLVAATVRAEPPEPKAPPAPVNARGEATRGMPAGFRGVAGQVTIGESAPGFELTNAEGKAVRLSSFLGTRVLLCFADRRDMIPQYRAAADSLLASGVQMVAIAHDSPRSLRALSEREGLSFQMLSDPTGEVSSIYGSYDAGSSTIRPGYILVGPQGRVRMAVLGQRLPPTDLVQITRYTLTEL